MKPLISIIGPVSSRSGYGDAARPFCYNLINLYNNEYDFEIIDINWGVCPRDALKDDYEINNFLKKYIVKNLSRQPNIHFHISVPNEYQPLGMQFNIGYTAGIETTLCHVSWLEGLNRMNYNLVMSDHIKKVFEGTKFSENTPDGRIVRQLGCTKPIEILHVGTDIEIFNSKKFDISSKISKYIDNEINEEFCYLFVGHWTQGDFGHDRKNIGTLIKIFLEAFKNKEKKPALVLKTSSATFSHLDRAEILKKINEIKSSVPDCNTHPNIYIIHGDLKQEEMNDLYCHPKMKAMVNLTHGEGFGIPLLEFSMTGKPIITTAWSGHMDFLDKEGSVLVGGKIEQLHPSSVIDGLLVKESGWFFPDVNVAGAVMLDMFNHYSKYSKNSYKLAITNRDKFNLNRQKEKIKEFFERIIKPEIDKIPKMMEVKLPEIKKFELPKLIKV